MKRMKNIEQKRMTIEEVILFIEIVLLVTGSYLVAIRLILLIFGI